MLIHVHNLDENSPINYLVCETSFFVGTILVHLRFLYKLGFVNSCYQI